MKRNNLFSIKMRASSEREHISGAERIVPENEISKVVKELTERALYHPKGKPDSIHLKIELLEKSPIYLKLLDIYEIADRENYTIKEILTELFKKAKIDSNIGLSIYRALISGASPAGTVMRGAMIVDCQTGIRLEPDKFRGIRASYMDITPEAEENLKNLVGERFTPNMKDAVVLSTKVLSHPDVIAELCISDDPDYTTGYFSIKGLGYIRIRNIKPYGLSKGGRAFFVKGKINRKGLIEYMETTPVLINKVGNYTFAPLSSIILGA
ncbi:6-carboxyhexanoate--CoA ligase [Desulfurobacterium sp.]|uniref:6-carboxyhexanoate--CoA ligase n=1 Tax=Desulfurobacterium sp. TaxID=2004706 RepID=UPI0026250B1B|nr:6-carboxyhexanoate--CoA ligase [Desulfurobacterium sp.]